MNPNVPIVNAGPLYVNGLQLSRTSAKVLAVAPGAARNSTDVNDIIVSSALAVNGAFVGANGVDVAVLAASSFYYVYVIGDSTSYNAPAALLSLSATPSLPFGYDMYRRIGFVKTDGSSNLLQFWQYGSDQSRTYYWDAGIAVTTANVTAFTALSLAAGAPPINCEVLLDLIYAPNAAANEAEFIPFGSAATVGIAVFGYGVAAAQHGNLWVQSRLNASAPSVQYKLAASDALTTLVVGFKDYL